MNELDKEDVQSQSIWYVLPGDNGFLEFPKPIVEYFQRHQQVNLDSKEAGGQIFWQYAREGHKRVTSITGPRPTDQRSRSSYKADFSKEQKEIEEHYSRGMYFLGDWHTHPEKIAQPSAEDILCIQEIYSHTNKDFELLLVIIGTDPVKDSISVSLCNDKFTTLKQANLELNISERGER